ncbi:MAG: hypothetical protein LBP19_09915 [Treponema sp.]|jgi:hypothetical protein|nr:hypothetical protein [Treponema sp.]
MKTLDERLGIIKTKLNKEEPITIMIIGLGSVGLYLLDYLVSASARLPALRIVVAGRNESRMESDVNIVRIASLIREQNRTVIQIDSTCELDNSDKVVLCIARHKPDFIVNTSRVYSGLKYGTISWHNLRAYGIWSPLAIRYIRTIMAACDVVDTNAVVINTSYSDVVIPWLKSAGKAFPDFGSGNLNHLVPRIKFAAADMANITDYWNIEVRIVTAHFHDVVISKEGHTENTNPLLSVCYKGMPLDLDTKELYSRCKIDMPVDAKRNMMNASSNFDIICSLIKALMNEESRIFHSPGAFGYVGGYPVSIDGIRHKAYIDESVFKLEDMVVVNKKSIAFDGVESVEHGVLTYTEALREKTRKVFGVELPKQVTFDAIDETTAFIMEKIITPNT